MWTEIVTIYQNYIGSGFTIALFLAAWIYLLLREKTPHLRVLFVYVPGVLLLLFFNPLLYALFQKMGQEEVYYRIFWLTPYVAVLAYSIVKLAGELLERVGRKLHGIFLVGAVLLIVAGGKLVYCSPYFSRAENIYHVPDSVAEICDAIELPGREVMAVFPIELVQYVRQYSPVVCMPYGRDMLVESWNEWAPESALRDEMEADEPDAETLCSLAREESCVYIVISSEKPIRGNMEDHDYALFAQIEGYNVYKDTTFTE